MAEARRSESEIGDVAGARVLVVEARFYAHIADALWAGAARALEQARAQVTRLAVPGALEIPIAMAIALDAAARCGTRYDGAVALGCVIRGETSHYDIVAGESARALMHLGVARALPIGNGVLTVDREAQALARAGGEKLDKGWDAARAALTLIAIQRQLAQRE